MKKKRELKNSAIVLLMSQVGFWWVVSLAGLDSAYDGSYAPLIIFVVTSFFMAWFCFANFVARGTEHDR